jgi:hypothetical protein
VIAVLKRMNLSNWGWRILPALLLIFAIQAKDSYAQDRVAGQERVDIVIRSPERLILRVGSQGGRIDVIQFQVGSLPGSGPIPGVSSGDNPVTVMAKSKKTFGQMILTADSSLPLISASGDMIPFSEISWTGTGDMPTGIFSGQPDQILFSSNAKNVRGAMSFSYSNKSYVPAGTYLGQVLFTLSSP